MPAAPFVSVNPPVQVQVINVWLVPQPLGVREMVGATLKPLVLPLSGLDGLAGSTRSRPGGKQSLMAGLTRSPADDRGDADADAPVHDLSDRRDRARGEDLAELDGHGDDGLRRAAAQR